MCDFNDSAWLPADGGCTTTPIFVVSRHYLGYPSGEVATGAAARLCGQHVLLPLAQFFADDGKKVFGFSVMRVGEGDKIALRGQNRRIGQ